MASSPSLLQKLRKKIHKRKTYEVQDSGASHGPGVCLKKYDRVLSSYAGYDHVNGNIVHLMGDSDNSPNGTPARGVRRREPRREDTVIRFQRGVFVSGSHRRSVGSLPNGAIEHNPICNSYRHSVQCSQQNGYVDPRSNLPQDFSSNTPVSSPYKMGSNEQPQISYNSLPRKLPTSVDSEPKNLTKMSSGVDSETRPMGPPLLRRRHQKDPLPQITDKRADNSQYSSRQVSNAGNIAQQVSNALHTEMNANENLLLDNAKIPMIDDGFLEHSGYVSVEEYSDPSSVSPVSIDSKLKLRSPSDSSGDQYMKSRSASESSADSKDNLRFESPIKDGDVGAKFYQQQFSQQSGGYVHIQSGTRPKMEISTIKEDSHDESTDQNQNNRNAAKNEQNQNEQVADVAPPLPEKTYKNKKKRNQKGSLGTKIPVTCEVHVSDLDQDKEPQEEEEIYKQVPMLKPLTIVREKKKPNRKHDYHRGQRRSTSETESSSDEMPHMRSSSESDCIVEDIIMEKVPSPDVFETNANIKDVKVPLPNVPLPNEPLPKEPLPKEPLPKVPLPKVPLPKVPIRRSRILREQQKEREALKKEAEEKDKVINEDKIQESGKDEEEEIRLPPPPLLPKGLHKITADENVAEPEEFPPPPPPVVVIMEQQLEFVPQILQIRNVESISEDNKEDGVKRDGVKEVSRVKVEVESKSQVTVKIEEDKSLEAVDHSIVKISQHNIVLSDEAPPPPHPPPLPPQLVVDPDEITEEPEELTHEMLMRQYSQTNNSDEGPRSQREGEPTHMTMEEVWQEARNCGIPLLKPQTVSTQPIIVAPEPHRAPAPPVRSLSCQEQQSPKKKAFMDKFKQIPNLFKKVIDEPKKSSPLHTYKRGLSHPGTSSSSSASGNQNRPGFDFPNKMQTTNTMTLPSNSHSYVTYNHAHNSNTLSTHSLSAHNQQHHLSQLSFNSEASSGDTSFLSSSTRLSSAMEISDVSSQMTMSMHSSYTEGSSSLWDSTTSGKRGHLVMTV